MAAILQFRQREAAARIDVGPSTLTSELIDLPAPLVHAPRIPRNHQPVQQRRQAEPVDAYTEHRRAIEAKYSIGSLAIVLVVVVIATIACLIGTVRGAS